MEAFTRAAGFDPHDQRLAALDVMRKPVGTWKSLLAPPGVCPTISVKNAKIMLTSMDAIMFLPEDVRVCRRMTVEERLTIQGFPSKFSEFIRLNHLINSTGEAPCVHVIGSFFSALLRVMDQQGLVKERFSDEEVVLEDWLRKTVHPTFMQVEELPRLECEPEAHPIDEAPG